MYEAAVRATVAIGPCGPAHAAVDGYRSYSLDVCRESSIYAAKSRGPNSSLRSRFLEHVGMARCAVFCLFAPGSTEVACVRSPLFTVRVVGLPSTLPRHCFN